jgi:hypothetical protein
VRSTAASVSPTLKRGIQTVPMRSVCLSCVTT